MHPLNNLMSEMRLSDSHRPLDFSSPGGSFHRPSLTPCQSYHSSDSSSPSLSSNQGSFSGNSFQYGQYSFNSHDRISSDSALAQNQIVPFDPSAKSLRVVLLHGTLDIWVYEAKNLPNMDMFSERMRQVFTKTASGKVSTKIEEGVSHQQVITSDPYVSISLSSAIVARTRVISNDQNPVWTQHFSIHVAHNVAEISFIVKDSDFIGAQLMGTVEIPAERLLSGQKIENWYPVLGPNGKVCRAGAALKLAIQFFPVEYQALYRFGIGAGPDYSGVPNTYFPLRKGGKVTLYQDAHVPDNLLPSIKLDHRATFKHGKCWQDISEAIVQARRLIYITGWSIYDKIKLVRGSSNSNVLHAGSTLGDLLKYKSQEGLRVLLLVWDDPTSRDILGFQKDGLMQTHDEETRRFFKHSSVQVLLCPRSAGKRHSWVKQQEVGAIFTHHQKSVLVDSEAIGGRRKITAFIGGLDLCDGRFDTPEHHLFRSLGTFHKDDYHNPTFTAGIDSGGPREPWHDLHCRIDGPAAYDVLYNFEQRWTKAAKRHGLKKLKRWNDDALLQLDRLPEIIGISELNTFNDNDPETWHVQVFRSIDSGSVKGFPKDVKEAETRNLVYLKNLIVDMSIHTAYVEAIRSAQHFIYIENQYFIGSSYNWSAHKDIGANNMIPMELALKIADKIRAHERFAVYVLIPMWPEGIPTSIAMQRILYWQGQTMQMMYETIFKALEEVGLEKAYHPQDYLNFFCLGNCEARDNNEAPSKSAVPENTPHARALKNRRFMIYVHSKGMIVDDEYVILGSANINQRSMEGSRDTEIAMGAYQPQYTWSKKQEHPHGQVYGYRISLWEEHLAVMEDCFQHPESLECVRRVRDLSENYWKQFSANEVTEMKGHFMKYPVKVEANGRVKPLPGCETFPDIGGNILGTLGTPAFIQENLTI